jgi:hypothetical protein
LNVPGTTGRLSLVAVILVSTVVAACGGSTGSDSAGLPSGLGPVAEVSGLAWPTECESGSGAGALIISSTRSVAANPSYSERQARGCLPYSLATVWQALQVPTGIDVAFWPDGAEADCSPMRDVETGYSVSFLTKEIPHGGIQSHYTFDVTWRGDVTQGTLAAPTQVKMLYGKTAGTEEVPWLRGSVVFTADPANAGWTRMELVRQYNSNGHADDQAKLLNWLQRYFDGLQTQLSTGSLARYCSPPSDLTYSTNPAVYAVGSPITANTPSSGGGAVTSYSVSPALPPGLSLDTARGVISGTPTAVAATATYVVAASNSIGRATVGVVLTVNMAPNPPRGLVYSPNPAVYYVGAPIAPNAPSSGGGAVTSYSVSPAFPAGLSLNTTTGVISGTPTAVAATATYTILAANADGSTTAAIVVTVNAPVVAPSNLVYSTNPAVYTVGRQIAANTPSNSGGQVEVYLVSPTLPAGLSINATTGAISGTPSEPIASSNYTVIAANSAGAASVSLAITIRPPPVASAGRSQTVAVGKLVSLDGSASADADGKTLTYSWTLATVPVGSTAALSNPTIARPTFLADVAGVYVATLVVNNGTVDSNASTVNITCVNDLSLLFAKQPFRSAVIFNGVIQAGSVYALTISNISSSSTFQLTRFEVTNGGVVVGSTTSPSDLSDGELLPGESVGLRVTFLAPQVGNGIRATYYLTDPVTSGSFTVSLDFGPF